MTNFHLVFGIHTLQLLGLDFHYEKIIDVVPFILLNLPGFDRKKCRSG